MKWKQNKSIPFVVSNICFPSKNIAFVIEIIKQSYSLEHFKRRIFPFNASSLFRQAVDRYMTVPFVDFK